MSKKSLPKSNRGIKSTAGTPPAQPERRSLMCDHDIVRFYVKQAGVSPYDRKGVVRLLKKIGLRILPRGDGEIADQVVTEPEWVFRLPWQSLDEATQAIADASGGEVEIEWWVYDEADVLYRTDAAAGRARPAGN